MELEMSADIAWWIKVVAAIVGLLFAYAAKGDWFRQVLTQLIPSKVRQEKIQQSNMDVAWRQLMDDSIRRGCKRSINLLNEWMICRTTGRIDGHEHPAPDESK